MSQSSAQQPAHDDSAALLAEAKSGSREAIGALLERHRAYLWALAKLEIAGETHLTVTISDVVRSAQLEAARDLPNFRGSSGTEFRSWLRQILRNNVIELKSGRDRTVPAANDCVPLDEKQARNEDPIVSGQAEAGELDAKLREAIRGLPADERTVIEMHYFAGKSYAEVAESLERPSEAIRTLWARALARLQSAIRKLP